MPCWQFKSTAMLQFNVASVDHAPQVVGFLMFCLFFICFLGERQDTCYILLGIVRNSTIFFRKTPGGLYCKVTDCTDVILRDFRGILADFTFTLSILVRPKRDGGRDRAAVAIPFLRTFLGFGNFTFFY